MWFELLITGISSGSLASIVTWFISAGKRNNDFISELQNSIHILSSNYTETLNKLVEVQRQNAELLMNQEQLKLDVEKLSKENAKLIAKINELNKRLKNNIDEKNNDSDNTAAGGSRSDNK